MYYLLGYRILGQCEQRMKSLMKLIEETPDKRTYRRHFDQNEDLHVYYKDILGPRLLLEVNLQNKKILNSYFFYNRQKTHLFSPLMVMWILVQIPFEC
jgi:hypothetical protein